MKTFIYKRVSLLLSAIAMLFVAQSGWYIHKPEVPEELLK
jgi:cyclic lactone autoinducer peptide